MFGNLGFGSHICSVSKNDGALTVRVRLVVGGIAAAPRAVALETLIVVKKWE